MDPYESDVAPASATCHCGEPKLAVYRSSGEPRALLCPMCDALPIALMRAVARSQHPGSGA